MQHFNKYRPVNNKAPIRGSLIAQLEKNWDPGAKISIQGKAINGAVGKMFDFEPLVALTSKEERLLKEFMGVEIASVWKDYGEIAQALARGEARVSAKSEDGKLLSKKGAIALFSDGKKFSSSRIHRKNGTDALGDGCRKLAGYRD